MTPAGEVVSAESIRDSPVDGTRGDDEGVAGRTGSRPVTAWTQRLILLTIMVCAAAARVPGIRWGLPTELHPDEPVVVKGAIGLIARGSFEPTVFYRPDHLEIKLDSIVFRSYAFFAGGRADEIFRQDPAVFIALARTVTVVFGVAAVGLAFLVGRRFGRWVGPIAAFLVAFYPPFVANSALATPDMPLTCLLIAVVWFCLRYLERPSWQNLVGSCAFTALAVAAKYPGALGAIPIVAVIVVELRRSGDRGRAVRHLLLAPISFLVALFVISPTLVTNFAAVRAQLVGQSGSGHPGASGLSYPGRAAFYLGYVGGWLGIVLVAMALIGLYECVRARSALSVPLLLSVPFWLAISALGLHWYRWSLPIAITAVFLAAIGLDTVIERTAALRTPGRPHARIVTAGVVGLLVLSGMTQLGGTAATAAAFTAADTRILALPWLRTHGITSENSVLDGYTPYHPGGPTRFTDELQLRDGTVLPRRPGMKYVMISSYMFDRAYPDSPEPCPEGPCAWEYYRAVERLPLLAQWVPTADTGHNGLPPLTLWASINLAARYAGGATTGPTIKLYALPTAGSVVG